jgi:Sporulation and spore germination
MGAIRFHPRIPWTVIAVIAAVAVGLLARLVSAQPLRAAWLPWAAPVTIFYPDATGRFLVPVATYIDGDRADPATLAHALASRPPAGLGLQPLIAGPQSVRHVAITGGVARLDLSAEGLTISGDTPLARQAILQSVAAWPAITGVQLSVDGTPDAAAVPARLIYGVSGDLLAAVPVRAVGPRDLVDTYLVSAAEAGLVGLPADVRLLGYELDARSGLLRLNFSYSPGIQEFATHNPELMRSVLLGLIATMTAVPEVEAVMLDFEGRARLGVGQCADLLRTPQRRPAILNDARTLAR